MAAHPEHLQKHTKALDSQIKTTADSDVDCSSFEDPSLYIPSPRRPMSPFIAQNSYNSVTDTHNALTDNGFTSSPFHTEQSISDEKERCDIANEYFYLTSSNMGPCRKTEESERCCDNHKCYFHGDLQIERTRFVPKEDDKRLQEFLKLHPYLPSYQLLDNAHLIVFQDILEANKSPWAASIQVEQHIFEKNNQRGIIFTICLRNQAVSLFLMARKKNQS